MNATEVIHRHEGQWWFWNEGFVDRIGPYVSEQEARRALVIYIQEHLG